MDCRGRPACGPACTVPSASGVTAAGVTCFAYLARSLANFVGNSRASWRATRTGSMPPTSSQPETMALPCAGANPQLAAGLKPSQASSQSCCWMVTRLPAPQPHSASADRGFLPDPNKAARLPALCWSHGHNPRWGCGLLEMRLSQEGAPQILENRKQQTCLLPRRGV